MAAPELAGAVWEKSSYSGSGQGQCVEVAVRTPAPFAGKQGVRDSKQPHGPALLFPSDSFADFVTGIKTGDI